MLLDDGSPSPGAAQDVVAALRTPGDPGMLHVVFHVVRTATPLPEVGAGESRVISDQTNVSVVAGGAVVVKFMRSPAPGPALTVLSHLAEVGFTGVPATYGALLRGDAPVAIATEYLPGAEDGWTWCVASLASGAGSSFAAELGRLAARLHVALATPSSVLPLPSAAADPRPWHLAAVERLAELPALYPDLDAAAAGPERDRSPLVPSVVLAAAADRMRAELGRLLDVDGPTPVQVIHGDLHVGQVLRWRGGLAVIDFDGSPVVGATGLEPAARDLAQLLLSVDHVARIVDRRSGWSRTAELSAWSVSARAELLAAYQAELATLGRSDVLDARLLPPFLVEQAVRDLLYSARYLPRWTYATIDGLETVLASLP